MVKWSDESFYRVFISKEFAHNIEVTFVDYGNTITVPRNQIFAPIAGLKQLVQQPFGIRCSSPDLLLSRPELVSKIMIGKTLRVTIGPLIPDHIYTVYLAKGELEKDILKSLKLMIASGKDIFIFLNYMFIVPLHQILLYITEKETNSDQHQLNTTVVDFEEENTRSSKLSPTAPEFSPPGLPKAGLNSELPQYLSPPPTPSCDSILNDFLLSPAAFTPSIKSNEYPPQPVLDGQRFLEVVYNNGPGDFYCQLTDSTIPLDEMMTKLSQVYSSNKYYF